MAQIKTVKRRRASTRKITTSSRKVRAKRERFQAARRAACNAMRRLPAEFTRLKEKLDVLFANARVRVEPLGERVTEFMDLSTASQLTPLEIFDECVEHMLDAFQEFGTGEYPNLINELKEAEPLE